MIVIKIGGHLLFDGEDLRVSYLKDLLNIFREITESVNDKIITVVGGGRLARLYINAARKYGVNEGVLDQLGIIASRLNASLLYSLYYNRTPIIPQSLEAAVLLAQTDLDVVFMGGLQPGQSTTTVAALVAEATNSKLVIATNVDGIYTSDPRKDPNAVLLKEAKISFLEKLFNKEQLAGEYRMLDSLALKIISRSKIETHVVNGANPRNIYDLIVTGKRVGTRIIFD